MHLPGFALRAYPLRHRRPLRHFHQARFVSCATGPSKRIVFLGTPPVAANTLQTLHQASQSSEFDISAVITQPPAPAGRKRLLTKSPVHQLAESLSIPVLTPTSARDPQFLDTLSNLNPDLCITAAYGNFLPNKFLRIPHHGTLNIHPSLLPAFRGAAPVPRALQAGVEKTGVCVLKTVLKMDAGPIVAIRERMLTGDEQAPQLLEELFDIGTHALLDALPSVWDGSVTLIDQDENLATHAAKVSKDEARLTFTENAFVVHNKVRAFAGWPGTWADFVVDGRAIRVKVMHTKILRAQGGMCLGVHEVRFDEGALRVTCDDGSVVGVLSVQPEGKKVMDARSFWNGAKGKPVQRKRVPH